MAVYRIRKDSLYLYEIPLYGSSRLGVVKENKLLKVKTAQNNIAVMSLPIPVNIAQSKNTPKPNVYTMGKKHYESTDWLGNVRVTYTDKKSWQQNKFALNVSSSLDYYPFGSVMEGREYNLAAYRFGFNGKENDNEVIGMGRWQDYGARMYRPDLARFFSPDPIMVKGNKYPFYSFYQFAGNKPILAVDLDGKEDYDYLKEMARKAKEYLLQKTSEYVMKKVYDAVSTEIEAWYNSLNYKDQSKIWQAILMYEFITGTGPESREFGPDHPLTKDVAASNMTTIALNKIYNKYLSNKKNKYYVSVTFPHPENLDIGDTCPIREYLADKEYTAAQFTGSATYYYYIDFKNKIINITVYDTKSEKSFKYNLPGTDKHKREEDPIMGETEQFYFFSITFEEFNKRTGKNIESLENANQEKNKNAEQ
ncbi:MAG: hypothetical protein KatS3mg035_2227 [Bacteroidia bacterium]|nr:MAG: hypothetical protein KatS3mg035_2227 [Bacteroidia bacterium]